MLELGLVVQDVRISHAWTWYAKLIIPPNGLGLLYQLQGTTSPSINWKWLRLGPQTMRQPKLVSNKTQTVNDAEIEDGVVFFLLIFHICLCTKIGILFLIFGILEFFFFFTTLLLCVGSEKNWTNKGPHVSNLMVGVQRSLSYMVRFHLCLQNIYIYIYILFDFNFHFDFDYD